MDDRRQMTDTKWWQKFILPLQGLLKRILKCEYLLVMYRINMLHYISISFIWPEEEKIRMWKVNGRRTPSDGKSSHCYKDHDCVNLNQHTYCWNLQLEDLYYQLYIVLPWHFSPTIVQPLEVSSRNDTVQHRVKLTVLKHLIGWNKIYVSSINVYIVHLWDQKLTEQINM